MTDKNWPSIVISKLSAGMDSQGDAPGSQKIQTMDALDGAFDAAIESQISSINGKRVWIWKGVGITVLLPDPKELSRRRYDIQGARISVTLEPHPTLFESAAESIISAHEKSVADHKWAKLKSFFHKSESPEKRAERKYLAARFLAKIWMDSLQSTLTEWTKGLSSENHDLKTESPQP